MNEANEAQVVPSDLRTDEKVACINWFSRISVEDQERLTDEALGDGSYTFLTLHLYGDVVKDAQNFMARSWESDEAAREAARRSIRLSRQVQQMRQNKRFVTEEMMIRHYYFDIIEIYLKADYTWPQILLHLKADLRIKTSAAFLKRIYEDECARRNFQNEA